MRRCNALRLAACAVNGAEGHLEEALDMLARAGEQAAIPVLRDLMRDVRRARETIILLLDAESGHE